MTTISLDMWLSRYKVYTQYKVCQISLAWEKIEDKIHRTSSAKKQECTRCGDFGWWYERYL